ncbi:MAG: T9SS type A sorting domain-containing protein, partial [FCB group bacterium]|nr:T9SS type A sorting domain-containing protein [FCB group bacterium]
VPFSQIGATSYNAAVIKNYLAYIYSTSEYPPDYVLLVGDQTVLPVHSTYTPDPVTYFSSYSLPGDYINENYYACLEGDDYLPEVYLGRLVANSPTYIMLLVNKVIKYEKTPNVGQTDWYTKAIMTSDQSEASQRQTKLTVRNILLNDGGFTQVDTLFEIGYISQFINWVNQGRSVVNYRGAGWDNIWSGIGLSAYNLSNLTNYNMLPMVTGIGCGGALFSSYCLGEAWMNQGTINNPTGAVLFIGPTWNTHTNFNNRLDLGIYEHMWQDSLREIGPAFMEGKMDVEAFFSLYYGIPGYGDVQEVVRTLFNQYMLMSDPNITVRAQPPRTMMVEHTTEVYLGPGEIEISVTDDLGNPLEGLVASAYISGETFSAELTDVNGEALLNINPQSRPNQLYITVTGLDYNPYYTNLEVMANSQFVSHYEYEIDDGPGGDGIVSPGETIDLTETVKNYGIAAAYNVNGLLSSPASALVIINDSSFFGDIPVEMTATGSQSYTFTLPSDYSLSELPLTLDISDNAGYQWQSDLTIQVKMPSLAYEGFIVNGSLNRGDIADIIVSMGNIGTLAAVNLTGTLESLDPEVIVMEDESDYDLINPGQILNNSGDPFQIQISYYCPTYFDAHFRFTIEGDQGTFNLHEEYEFEIEVSEPGQIDPGFDNAGIYYAYEMSDSIYSQAPEYWRDDMASLASRTGIVIEMDPETQIAYLEFPPDFTWRYYGQDYDILSISADGFIAPGEVPYTTSSNYGIPRSDQIEGMVAPLWYDMYCLVAEPGEISYYFDPEGRLIIEYYNWSHANTNMMTETFQIVIYDPETMPTLSGDSVIEFYYGEVTYEALWNSTCGIEAPSQTDGIEMWQNTSYPITTHPPEPYSVIRFTSDPPVVDIITSIYPKGGVSLTPLHLELEQNFPNPFNPATNIRYRIADKGAVKLAVYNIMGEEVAELVDSYLEAGEYTAVWKADSKPSGIYFIRLVSDDKIISRKALLLK